MMKFRLLLIVIMLFLSCLRLKGLKRSSSSSSFSQLIMNIPIHLRGFTDIINMYDIFLIDQFGVLHDGNKALPGSIELLDEIKRKVGPSLSLSLSS